MIGQCAVENKKMLLRNVPRISDVETMMELIETLGARVEWRGPNTVAVDASGVHHCEVDRGLSERIRASFLLAGPLR